MKWTDGTSPPSQNRDVDWIYMDSPDNERTDEDFACRFWREEDAIHIYTPNEHGEFSETEQYRLTEENIDIIAEKYDILWGKWMVFKTPDLVDGAWERIAVAVSEGQLGLSAKVATLRNIEDEGKDDHLICVFTEDYRDALDVRRVRSALRELGVVERIYYKPDIYTYLRIYSGKGSIKYSINSRNTYSP